MERDNPLPFYCDCGGEPLQVIPEQQDYLCPRCRTQYFLLYVPFDVLNLHEKFLIKRASPQMQAICSEVAIKRLMAYFDRSLISKVDVQFLQSQECVDIHTISKCLNYTLKVSEPGYVLMYRRPITTQVMTLSQMEPLILRYLMMIREPLIVSVIPKGNWQHLMDSLDKGKSFGELYAEALHTVLITGFSMTGMMKLCVHDHINNLSIEEQRPYRILPYDRFEYAHTLADFRCILNLYAVERHPEILRIVTELYRKWP